MEFDISSTILDCNQNFVEAMGYTSKRDIVGRKHRDFILDEDTPQHESFWAGLRNGHSRSGEFRRRGKEGKEIFFQAVYTPIVFGTRIVKVVKFATDVTLQRANAILLSNMLPLSIANELRNDPHRRIAHSHESVTILFADVVGKGGDI